MRKIYERRLAAGLARPVLLLAVLLTACITERDRPTGPGGAVPPTSVSVIAPPDDRTVGVDSVIDVTIRASGSIRAVEFVVTRTALPDTLGRERSVLETAQADVQMTFQFRIPQLPTSTSLEVRGVAEDAGGERHRSEPIFLTVIDCEQFPLACGGGLGAGVVR